MRKPQVDWTVWQNASVAGGFADRRRSGIPGAQHQFDVIRRLVERVPGERLRVLDVGCGDGYMLSKVMEARDMAFGVALDGSPAMLERARERFRGLGTVDLVEADFNLDRWTSRLPSRQFDVVVSAFAIHHSEDDRKFAIYSAIHDLLAPGGVFINTEHVASASRLGEELWEDMWAEYDVGYRRAQGETVDFDTVKKELQESDEKAANRLCSVETQLRWLREIGFEQVDCYWKYFELAVMAGFKHAESVD